MRWVSRRPRTARSWSCELAGVVEDDAQRVARPRDDAAHAVAHGAPIHAPGALAGSVARREDDDLAPLGGDRLAPRLGPRPLLDQQEVAARVIDTPPAQEARELQGKDDIAVDILVQAVVAAALIAQQERRGPGLASPPADREQPVERRRVHERGLREGGLPPIGDR